MGKLIRRTTTLPRLLTELQERQLEGSQACAGHPLVYEFDLGKEFEEMVSVARRGWELFVRHPACFLIAFLYISLHCRTASPCPCRGAARGSPVFAAHSVPHMMALPGVIYLLTSDFSLFFLLMTQNGLVRTERYATFVGTRLADSITR